MKAIEKIINSVAVMFTCRALAGVKEKWIFSDGLGRQMGPSAVRKSPAHGLIIVLLAFSLDGAAMAQGKPLVLERDGRVISLEPYAPNILRVTMSTDKATANAAPGYGFVAKPSDNGWTHERAPNGDDVFRSARMIVRIAARDSPADKLPQSMPVDSLMDSLGRQMLPDDDDDSESSQSRNQTPLPESKQFARSTRRHRQ